MLAFENPLILAALAAAITGAALLAHAGRLLLRAALFGVPFALLIALVNPLVADEGLTVLWRFGELGPLGKVDVTLEGLAFGAILGLRALLIVLASAALLTATVDADELLRGFRRISVRSALTAALAVRLVPVLGRDARRLADARRCRPDATPRPGAAERLQIVRAVATGALDRALDVAATLEVRGYATPGAARAAAPARAVVAPRPRVRGVDRGDPRARPRRAAARGRVVRRLPVHGRRGRAARVAARAPRSSPSRSLPFADRRGIVR